MVLVLAVREDFSKRTQFGGVTDGRTRAVRLNQTDFGRLHARSLVGATQRDNLAARAGSVDALEPPIAAGSDSLDDGVDPVPVSLGILQSAESQHSDALSDKGAVRLFIEGADDPPLGESRRLREAHVHQDRVLGVAATRDHHVGTPEDQFIHGHPHRSEGAGARRVDGTVRAAKIEAIRDTSRHDVAEHAGKGILLPRGKALAEQVRHLVCLGCR